VNAVLARQRSRKNRVLLHLPTGAGKTVIAALLIEQLLKMSPTGRILFAAHRQEIVDQTAEKIAAHFGDIRIGIEQGDRSAGDERVVVASIPSLHQRLEKFNPADFTAIIVDECHHIHARTWLETIRHFDRDQDKLLVGMTATPRRTDGRSADQFFDELAFEITLDRLQDLGYLVPMEYFTVEASIGLDSLGLSASGDFQAKALAAAMNTPELRALAIRAWRERSQHQKTIAFCASVAHAEAMTRDLLDLGVQAAVITGATKNRSDILDDFRKGRIQVIANYGVLTEGFDDPSIECVLLSRPTTSPLVYNQCLGRGLRAHPGKKKCTVIDIIDRSIHKLQFTAYEAAGFPQGYKAAGKDPLREARAIAAIRVRDPAAFLRIKRALSLEETQSILMSLPEADVLSGIGGAPLIRYEPASEPRSAPEAIKGALGIMKELGLFERLTLLETSEHKLKAVIEPGEIPELTEFHVRHATGWPLEIHLVAASSVPVLETDGERLKSENPKGRLLELVQQGILISADIHLMDLPDGFSARGEMYAANRYVKTPVHHCRTKKRFAEQAAAAALLSIVRGSIRTLHNSSSRSQQTPSPIDARQRINELVQKGVYKAFEYEEVAAFGPDHGRQFLIRARVLTANGWIAGQPMKGSTKKEAQASAVQYLWDILQEPRRPIQERIRELRDELKMAGV
jgi:superfamily II DNA or RNA helicase